MRPSMALTMRGSVSAALIGAWVTIGASGATAQSEGVTLGAPVAALVPTRYP